MPSRCLSWQNEVMNKEGRESKIRWEEHEKTGKTKYADKETAKPWAGERWQIKAWRAERGRQAGSRRCRELVRGLIKWLLSLLWAPPPPMSDAGSPRRGRQEVMSEQSLPPPAGEQIHLSPFRGNGTFSWPPQSRLWIHCWPCRSSPVQSSTSPSPVQSSSVQSGPVQLPVRVEQEICGLLQTLFGWGCVLSVPGHCFLLGFFFKTQCLRPFSPNRWIPR